MSRFIPADLDELRDAVADALAAEEPLELVAGRSKRGLGRPLQTPHTLDLSRLTGIRDYAPNELVLTAGAATPLAEIERVLAENGQMLAFEPPGRGGPAPSHCGSKDRRPRPPSGATTCCASTGTAARPRSSPVPSRLRCGGRSPRSRHWPGSASAWSGASRSRRRAAPRSAPRWPG